MTLEARLPALIEDYWRMRQGEQYGVTDYVAARATLASALREAPDTTFVYDGIGYRPSEHSEGFAVIPEGVIEPGIPVVRLSKPEKPLTVLGSLHAMIRTIRDPKDVRFALRAYLIWGLFLGSFATMATLGLIADLMGPTAWTQFEIEGWSDPATSIPGEIVMLVAVLGILVMLLWPIRRREKGDAR